MPKEKRPDFSKKQILKCRCRPGYTCSAPLHGTIEILSCEKNCGLGCANGSLFQPTLKK